jgi:hypothetical protein
MLRALHGNKEIDLKNDKLVKHISGILQENDCHEFCLGARYDQVNILFSLNPDIALNDLLNSICSSTVDLIQNELKINHFNGWNQDHIIFTHSTNFMRHIIDFIKADDEEYQEERMAREAEFYDRAKRGWLFDDLDPEFDDLILLDAEK